MPPPGVPRLICLMPRSDIISQSICGVRTYLEAYFAENMVAILPHNFCTQISIGNHIGIYKQNFKRKWGGMARVFWLPFGSQRDVTSGRKSGDRKR